MGIFDKLKGKPKQTMEKDLKPAEEKKPKAAKKAADAGEAKKTDKKDKGAARTKGSSAESNRIIVRPLFTEKTDRLQAAGSYTFVVTKDANKTEVARAIKDLYGVKPVSVRVTVRKGKYVRFGRSFGRRQDEKRAIVTLAKGDRITVMEGV